LVWQLLNFVINFAATDFIVDCIVENVACFVSKICCHWYFQPKKKKSWQPDPPVVHSGE